MTTGLFPPSNNRKNYLARSPRGFGWMKAVITLKAKARVRRDRIAHLLNHGADFEEIRRITGLCDSTVRAHIKRIKELNDASLQHHPDA